MHYKKGQTLIELLIIIGLMAILLPVLIGGLISSREGRPQQLKRAEAFQEVQKTKEALRSIREAGWNNISTNGTFHVETDGVGWLLSPGSSSENGITTEVLISDVRRDSNHTIVTFGGSIDPSTKKAAITVSWLTPLPTSITSTLYLTRYLDNATYIQTIEADFNTGEHTNTTVTNDNGGEVTLGLGGGGNWCAPELTIATLDLPKGGVANSLTAIEGRAFAGTGDNASGVAFAEVAISNTQPPVATIAHTIDGYKTNQVFGEIGYGYLTTDTNNAEVVIIDLSINSVVGTFDSPDSENGDAIFVSNAVGFMTSGQNLYTFDLSSKSGSRPLLGSVSLSGHGSSIAVLGNYAYVALTENGSRELQIIDVSNPSSPSIVGYANVAGEQGEDVVVNETGTRAYLVTRDSANSQTFFIINIETKTGSRPTVGIYQTNGMDPRGVVIVPGNKAIIVGMNSEEYQVVNIADEANPTRCGGIDLPVGITDVASVLESDGDAYSYILTQDASSEFRIIEGGPGGQYSATGIYESETFDLGYGTAFNRFIPTLTTPPNTTLQFQVSIVDPVSGSCNGVTHEFTGPDGTTESFYTETDTIAFSNDDTGYENPGRCFRYRAYFETTDSSSSPIFEEVTVNYSP